MPLENDDTKVQSALEEAEAITDNLALVQAGPTLRNAREPQGAIEGGSARHLCTIYVVCIRAFDILHRMMCTYIRSVFNGTLLE